MSADLVLIEGTVLTMNPIQPCPDAALGHKSLLVFEDYNVGSFADVLFL